MHNLDILKSDETNAKYRYFSSIGKKRKENYNIYLKSHKKFRDAKYIGNWDYKYWKEVAIWTSVGIYAYSLVDALFYSSNNSISISQLHNQNNKTYSILPYMAPIKDGIKFGINFKW